MVGGERNLAARLIGVVLKNPDLAFQSEEYNITLEDFEERLFRIIYFQWVNMYKGGMEKFEINNFIMELKRFPEQFSYFEKNEGEEFISIAMELGLEENFDYYYKKLKKQSLLRSLEKGGFDTSEWVPSTATARGFDKLIEIEEKLETSSLQDILNSFQAKFYEVEAKFINKATFDVASASDGIDELLNGLGAESAVGLPLNGKILSTIVLGARKGKVLSVSGLSGAGKSRMAVANACKLSYPVLWDQTKGDWALTGSNQKTLFITTELSFDEIQTITLAYISGVDENKILTKTLTPFEEERVRQAALIMKKYPDNLFLYHMPDPNIQQLNTNVRKYAIRYQLDCLFYDYIHTSPNLLAEFAGTKIREDVALMLLSTALKNLANELDLFVWTSTQLNGELEDGKIAGVYVIRGAKAIIDKMDTAAVLRKIGPEDSALIAMITKQSGLVPSHSIDIFKNRRGKYNDVRLWIDFDLGTMRSKDLFLTTGFGEQIEISLIETRDGSVMGIDISEVLTTQGCFVQEGKC